MKKYNRTVNINVDVDAVAQKLLSTMDLQYPHRETLTEAIIGFGLDKDTIPQIYQALNGYVPTCDFSIGDIVLCTETTYQYKTPESREKRDSQRSELGVCTVVDINLYADNPVEVEYDYYSLDGSTSKQRSWVKPNKCRHTAVAELFS
jgi:hypothetical protein